MQTYRMITRLSSSGKGGTRSLTHCVAVSANGLHGLTSAPGIQLFQNSMNVIPHREFREIQVGGDLFVCQTLGVESHQLLLAHSMIRSLGRSLERDLFDHMRNQDEYAV